MNKTIKSILILFTCLNLAACAGGARYENMVTSPDSTYSISKNNKYYKAISIQGISGGKETNPMLMSKVDNPSFHKALEASLTAYGLLSDSEKSTYALDAELLALEQPVFGLTFDVDSVIQYEVKKTSNSSVVYNETIKQTGTATMGDAFVAVERLRLANEISVKNNIQNFIDQLTK